MKENFQYSFYPKNWKCSHFQVYLKNKKTLVCFMTDELVFQVGIIQFPREKYQIFY